MNAAGLTPTAYVRIIDGGNRQVYVYGNGISYGSDGVN